MDVPLHPFKEAKLLAFPALSVTIAKSPNLVTTGSGEDEAAGH